MNTLSKLQNYMEGRKILLPLSLLLSALSAASSMLPFIFIWLIVRDLLSHSGNSVGTQVNTYAWWAVGTAIGSILFYFIALMLSHLAAFRVEVNMRRAAMQKIVNMPLGFFDKNSSGRIRKIIDDDTSTTHIFLAHQLPDLAGTILMPLATLALIFIFDWRLGLACLVPIILAFSTMSMMMGKKGKKFQKMYLDAQEEMSSEAVEYVRGIPVVKVFQQTVFSFKRFYGSIIKYKEMVIKHTQIWEKPMSFYTTIIQSFAFFLVPVAILLIGRSGDFTGVLVDLFLYVLITPVFASSIMKSMYMNQNLFLAKEAVNRVENLINTEPLEISKNPQKVKSHHIVFKDVEFRYPDAGQNAVDGISFTVSEGETYALVGASGGGKTTIARLIPRFWDVARGGVSIGDVDVRDVAKEDLMNNVSFVFQNTKLFKTTLLENIKYGNTNAKQEEVERAVDLAQCREIIDRLPDGLNTKIGVEGTYLSGGEQQRIALARAILKDAPIVVLDEATAFTDPENEHLIQKALGKLTHNKTVLMIAHRLTSVKDVDKILVIEKGKIVEQGTHEQLLEKQGIYSRMWQEYQQAVQWTV